MGPLHDEPNRLLLEETPSAIALRPILDVIGAGAHRLSEIAGRIGQPATSLARPLARLQELEFVVREAPFGDPERGAKRALYKLADPFLSLWFSLIAPKRLGADYGPAARHWSSGGNEWDVVAASVDAGALLLGEVK